MVLVRVRLLFMTKEMVVDSPIMSVAVTCGPMMSEMMVVTGMGGMVNANSY